MKPALGILFFLAPFLFSSCFSVRNSHDFSYQKLRKEDYRVKLNTTQPHYLIDVRTPREYNKSHLAGAINVNYFSHQFAKKIDTLNPSIPTFIYCQTCHRSPLAAKIMKRKGFKTVYDLKGGYSQIDTN